MKRILLITVLVIGGLVNNQANAQTAPADTTKTDGFFNLYAGIYNLSSQFNDPIVTRMALYHLLMVSGNKTGILDSLALNFYDNQNWISVALVTKENLKFNPDNELALELAGLAYENLGIKDKSLDQYETLFLKNNETSTLYRVAFLQFELKRYKESLASTEILLNRTDINDQTLFFPKIDKTQQEVSMRSALLHLKGLIAKEEGDIQKAKEFYLEALKVSPGFEIAQKNLQEASK
ncbi:MAG: tetratricopeptide repeat protein [Cyclobacteriaceae bacterium]|jgi:tetratricopeptide (TPR) repeat protein|nr:tetratricopeptide repeat protein [Cyclobacteriaceae bacterium]